MLIDAIRITPVGERYAKGWGRCVHAGTLYALNRGLERLFEDVGYARVFTSGRNCGPTLPLYSDHFTVVQIDASLCLPARG